MVNSLVFTMDAYELMEYNKGRLTEAGASPEAIEAFYLNPSTVRRVRRVSSRRFSAWRRPKGVGRH